MYRALVLTRTFGRAAAGGDGIAQGLSAKPAITGARARLARQELTCRYTTGPRPGMEHGCSSPLHSRDIERQADGTKSLMFQVEHLTPEARGILDGVP